MCLGIVMILVGLALPSLAGARARAREVREVAVARSNAQLTMLYARDHADVFPRWHDDPLRSASAWWVPILQRGYAASPREVDPDFRPGPGAEPSSYQMSMAMVYRPELMAPGKTVVESQRRSGDVRASEVMFPASKGLVKHYWGSSGARRAPWCCLHAVDTLPFAAAYADGSATRHPWTALHREFPFEENGIGTVFMATWYGVRGRDR